MSFQKDFDALFHELMTDWQNQFPDADLSRGSLIWMKSACLASALWGLYKYQGWISAQIFPDSADAGQLEHHAWVHGMSRNAGEADTALLARLLAHLRRPPAGGNKYDYEKWAASVDCVARAWCIPEGQGLGTVDVLILADAALTGSEIPSSHALSGTVSGAAPYRLIDAAADFTNPSAAVRIGDIAVNESVPAQAVVTAVEGGAQLALDADIFTAPGQAYALKSLTAQVREYIDTVRPVTASILRVAPPVVITADVAMTVSGEGVNTAAIAAEITALLNTMQPGQTLYLSRLVAAAIRGGAENAVVSVPAADIPAGVREMIRAGAVTVA